MHRVCGCAVELCPWEWSVKRCNEKNAKLQRWRSDTLTYFLCRVTLFVCLFFTQMSQSCLDLKPASGVQAFRPRPCVTSQDIPPIGFLAFMARPSSPSTTHTSFLRVCVYTMWALRLHEFYECCGFVPRLHPQMWDRQLEIQNINQLCVISLKNNDFKNMNCEFGRHVGIFWYWRALLKMFLFLCYNRTADNKHPITKCLFADWNFSLFKALFL